MSGWRRTGFIIGGMWAVTWGFGLLPGYHTPMSFALALVGCTGLGLVIGCGLDSVDHWWQQP